MTSSFSLGSFFRDIFLDSDFFGGKERRFVFEYHDGDHSLIATILPSPVSGDRKLELTKVADVSGSWKKADENLKFLWRKPFQRFFLPGDTFALDVSVTAERGPVLLAVYLPFWNMHGTWRARLELPISLELVSGAAYVISLQIRKGDVRQVTFKYEDSHVYVCRAA